MHTHTHLYIINQSHTYSITTCTCACTVGWAHVVCALYIPEVTFGNLRTMEPIVTTKLPKERFSKVS